MTGRDSGALSMNKAIEKTLHVLKKVYIYIKQSQRRMCIQKVLYPCGLHYSSMRRVLAFKHCSRIHKTCRAIGP